MSGLRPGDDAVIARISRSPAGASAVEIAKASRGPRARKLSVEALTMIGLAVASSLCGQNLIEPTRTNNFRLTRRSAA